MTRITTILTEGFADWETALLNAAGRSYYGFATEFVSPLGAPVTSSGGMRVLTDGAVEDLSLEGLDALVVCGGTSWTAAHAPDIASVLLAARSKGVLIGGICDGVLALARAGLLDDVPHTGNGAEAVAASGYGGAAYYREQPEACLAGRIITAPGTSPVSFCGELFRSLGVGGPDLDYYLALYGREHRDEVRAAAA